MQHLTLLQKISSRQEKIHTYSKRNTLLPITTQPLQLTRSTNDSLSSKTQTKKQREKIVKINNRWYRFVDLIPLLLRRSNVDSLSSKTQTKKQRVAINTCHLRYSFQSQSLSGLQEARNPFILFPKLKQRNKRDEWQSIRNAKCTYRI